MNMTILYPLTHPLDHAGYYPGADRLHIKLIVERPTGKITRSTDYWRARVLINV